MTINARILITALFLIGLTSLRAQNQRLTWEGDEYAMRYEVVIEREEAGAYTSVLREFTEETFIEVSLSSGKYRCQVIPYDFLNQPVPVTEWIGFEVRPSYHEIIKVDEISTAPEPEKITGYKNPFDMYLSAAWIPFLPIYREDIEKIDESRFFGESGAVSPYGVGVRFAMVPVKQRLFNPGIELTVSWRIRTMLFDCDIIPQSLFSDDRAALKFRLGAGISLAAGDDSLWAVGQQYSTYFNIGGSLLFLFPKNFFLETGMEYSQFFTKEYFCFLRSWIGIGYRFGE
jgi:hypothetical protein